MLLTMLPTLHADAGSHKSEAAGSRDCAHYSMLMFIVVVCCCLGHAHDVHR